MYKWVHRFAWVAMAAMFFHNFFFWGGLARLPGIGERLDLQSQRDAADVAVAFYAQSGRDMMTYVAPNASRDYARNAIGEDTFEEIAGGNGAVPDQLREAMPWFPRLCYYGAPFMLLAALLLYWLRPKPIRSFGA